MLIGGGEAIFDPSSHIYTFLPRPPGFVYAAGTDALVLADGTSVLVTGGSLEATSGSTAARILDLPSRTWRPAGAMQSTHARHHSFLLKDGRVLVFGGISDPVVSEIFDPATVTWTLVPLPSEFTSLDGSVLENGAQLVDGDVIAVGRGQGTLRFHATSATWTVVDMKAPLHGMPILVRLADGRLFGYGTYGFGPGAAIFDPSSETWSRVSSPPTLRGPYDQGYMLSCGKILMFGARNPDSLADHLTLPPVLYDPADDSWFTPPGEYPYVVQHDSKVTLLKDGRLFVTYGRMPTGSPLRMWPLYYGEASR